MVRQKNRYILCEIVFPEGNKPAKALTDNDAYRAVRQAVQTHHGDYGIGTLLSSLNVKYMNADTGIIIIRASRAGYKMVTTSLPFIRKIGSTASFFKVLHIGGTIRTCQKFIVKYHRDQLVQLLTTTTDPEERKKIQAMLLESERTSENVVEIEEEDDPDVDSDG